MTDTVLKQSVMKHLIATFGHVQTDDNESGIASLSVEMTDGAYIDFDEPENASIEIIETAIQHLSVAV